MSKVKMSLAFIVIIISCLSVTVYISCIRHCLGAPCTLLILWTRFPYSNNDDVIIRAMTIVKRMTGLFVLPRVTLEMESTLVSAAAASGVLGRDAGRLLCAISPQICSA